ncbi:MAG: hypothetical protein K2N51_17345 [Lachnospiraceae bacterium]|nr:hypothetical protein [Lachnospiraceae bacterium]
MEVIIIILILLLLAQYTENGKGFLNSGIELGGLFDNLKVNVNSYKEIIDDFKNIESFDEFLDFDTNTINWDELSKAIGITDTRLRSYLETLDDGKGNIDNASASVEGLSKHLKKTGQMFDFTAIKATLLNTALNAGIMLAVSVALQSIVKGLDHFINRVKYAQEAMKEAQKAIDESQNKLKSANEVISENKKRFLELKQGVDKFSKNKFLSDEDYSEFLSISQQLAEISPDLVYNYDDQGNALLRLGKNVKETSKMLDEMLDIQEATADKTLVDNLDAVANGVYESVRQAEKEIENLQFQLNSDGKIGKNTAYTDIDILKTLKDTGVFTFDDEGYRDYGKKFEKALTNAGIGYSVDTNVNRKFLMLEDNDRLTLKNIQRAQKYYNDMVEIQKKGFTAEEAGLRKNITEKERLIDDYYSKMSANLGAWVKENYSYQSLHETNKAFADFVDNIIPTLDWDTINKDKFDSKGLSSYDYQNYIEKNILEPLTTLPDEYEGKVAQGLSKLLKFKDGDLGIVSFGEELQKFLDEKKIKIDITPIFSDEKEAYNKLQNSIKDIAGKSQNELSTLKSFTKNFTEEEANRWEQITLGADSATEAIVIYKSTLQDDYSSSIKELESSISSLTDTEELLNTALSEQAEKGTISQDTLVSLRDKYSNLSKVLEITANGVIINKDKLSELNAEEKKSVDNDLASTREKLVNQYNANSLAIAGYKMQLEDTNSMTDKQKSALEALVAVKESDQKQTSEQIAQLDLLGVQYDTLTSKTNKFLQSLSTADDGNIYDSVQSALEQVKEVYDEGDYGKDEFRNFVDYMSSEDMSTSSIDEIKSHYKEAMKTAERYFTENNKGVTNFVNDLKKLKMASQDANGSWTLNIGDIDEASKKLGISSDAMTDILNKLKDKGWKIDFTTADDDIVDVNAELNKLEKKLEKLTKKKVKLKADGKSTEEIDQKISTVEKSIEGIKSEIQLSIDTQEAKTKILEYQAMIDKLNKQPPTSEDMSSIANYKKKQKELADKFNLNLETILSVDTSKADEKIEDTKEKSEKETTFEVDADTKKAVQKINDIFRKTYNLDVNIKIRNSRNKVSNFLNGLESSEDKGNSKANGTALTGKAYVNGKRGRISAGYSAKSLVGELAPEMRVRDGQYEILGQNGAEFTDVRPDDIIFNGEQTKEILKNGKINSRGNAYNTGANGSGGAFESHTTSKKKKDEAEKKKKAKSSSDKKEKTALEKFQEWISKLFDWIEIKIQRQSEKIDKYITKAGNAKDSGNYGTSATNYRKAINATSTQVLYEQKAATKYNNQADKVVNKAVSMGIVSKKQAASIKKQVQNGSMNIKNYSDKIQEVIKDYQTWYEKSKDCSKAVEELHNNIRTYIQDLKDMRDAQRDAKLEKFDTYTSIGTSGYAYTYQTQNSQLNFSNSQLNKQNKAYDSEVSAVNNDVKNIGKSGKNAISKALKSKDAKGKSKNAKAYKKALNNANKAIKSKKAVSSADLKTIKSHSISVYNKLYAYNQSLGNLENAKLEQVANLATTTAEKFQNIAQKYENKDSKTNNDISLLRSKSENAASAKDKNSQLDKISSKYDTIVSDDKAEIAEYQKLQNSNSKTIKNKAGTGTNYKNLSKNSKDKSSVDNYIKKAKAAVKKGVTIGADIISKLAEYCSKGYVSKAFYEACMNYNNAIQHRRETEAQLEIDEQTAIQEKASIGTEKFNNIEQEYTNKQSKLSNDKNRESINQSIKTTKGFELDKSDYQTMLNYSKEEEKIYSDEIDSLNKTIQKNLDSGDWTENSQDFIDATNKVNGYKEKVLECQKEQEEWNNEIAQFPYTVFEKANNLLQSMKSKFQSLLDIKTTRGLDKTEEDILEEKDILDEQKRKKEDEIEQLKKDHQSALDAGGAYGGYTADEWLVKINEAETERNGLIKTDEELNNEMAQLPYTKLEKELNSLDAIANNNKSITDLIKAKGIDLSENDYLSQISDNDDRIKVYESKKLQAYKDYEKALASKDGVYGGKTAEEWLAIYREADTTINGIKTDNEEIRKALRDDVYWRTFERAHKAAKALKDILSGLSDLISDDMLYSKDGKLTDFGMAQMANSIKQYETAREEAQSYTNDIQNLNKLYAQGYYNQDEFNEKLNETQNGLFESASSMKSYISQIIDMNKNLAQSELDNLFKVIDARNEALQKKKNYYDFDKTIKGKTKDIQSLESQIAALEGIENAKAKADKAKLEADLADAKDDLNDTIINHSFELSQDALNELKDILQDEFDDRWDNIGQDLDEVQKLMASANELTAAQTSTIGNALNKLLTFYGIDADMTDLNLFGNITGYASGTKNVDKDKVAWTQENGEEIIIRRSDGAILTPLKQGDRVIPNDLSNNLFNWGRYNPQDFANSLAGKLPEIPKVQPSSTTIEQHYDSLLNVEGNVDSTVVTDLEKFAKKFYQGSYQYTIKEIARDARKKGIKV